MTISPPGREPFTCRIALIGCTCDLPAKALVLNAIQYNGFYGCSHCLQEGNGCVGSILLCFSLDLPFKRTYTFLWNSWSGRTYLSSDSLTFFTLGKTCKVGVRGRVHVFPYMVENPTGPTRTDADTRSNARDALSTDSPVITVKSYISGPRLFNCSYCTNTTRFGVN